MKILIVCEDDEVASCITKAFCDANECDVIVYNYLLKALDNVLEIAPDAVIINAIDYPMHWKAFVQYMACMDINAVTALYVDRAFSKEESQIARLLGISLIFCSIDDMECLDHIALEVLRLAQEANAAIGTAKTSPSAPSLYCPSSLIFSHPSNGAFVIGEVISFDGNTAIFAPDLPDLVDGIKAGDAINEVSYKKDGVMHSASSVVQSIESGGAALTLLLTSV